MSVDIVLPWVDGSDPEWRKIKAQYQENGDARDERFRDFDLLRYWFRGIDQCMPWVRTVHFITMNQVPSWLNVSNERLHIIDHRDYIPEAYLPTFNSNAIELNVYRIPELSEQFLLLNDDVLFLRETKETDYFRDGKPVDMLALQPVVANADNELMYYIYLNNSIVLARHFDKRTTMKQFPKAYFCSSYPLMYLGYNNLERMWPRFTGFFTAHGPSPLLKSQLAELWEMEYEVMDTASRNHFRDKTDVNQYLVREFNKLKGNFIPANILKDFAYFDLAEDNHKLYECLDHPKVSSICINDSNREIPFEDIKKELHERMERLFPKKSSFER